MRLTLMAHAETARTRDAVFGDVSGLLLDVKPLLRPVRATVRSAPEPACEATASLLCPDQLEVIKGLAGPDFAAWTGRPLAQIAESDPVGLQSWLTDPFAAPHGGESLGALVDRVGQALDAQTWPQAGVLVVVTPLVAKAALVHALGAPPKSLFHVDVPPRGEVALSRHDGSWRLTALRPPRRLSQAEPSV